MPGFAAPMLRNAGLPMQPSATAVSISPAPTNSSGSEIALSRLPAIAAESEIAKIGPTNGGRAKGAPTITVEKLAEELRTEGFQWRFVGRQITFTATAIEGGANPRLRIDGLKKDSFDTAVLHNARPDIQLKPGEKVRVTGLIVDQWYAVWQIWRYEMDRVEVTPK